MVHCHVYINEVSAQGQYSSTEWQEYFRLLIDCLRACKGSSQSCVNSQFTIFYTGNIFNRTILKDGTCIRQLGKMNNEVFKLFKLLLRNQTNWDTYSLSDHEAEYKFMDINGNLNAITGTSMSEAYESKQKNETICINFECSTVPEPIVKVSKHSSSATNIYSFSNPSTFKDALVKLGLIQKPYNRNTRTTPPLDEETILYNNSMFTPTKYSFQRRRIYRNNVTNELWYVDNLHYGLDAHLEVFNETTHKQVKICDINTGKPIRSLNNKEKNRTLKFD